MKKANTLFKILFLLVFTVTASCKHKNLPADPKLKAALDSAGSNRGELEKVLDHYSNPEDSLKYEAAVFLIKYMPGKYARVYSEYDDYKPVFDTLETLNAAYDKRTLKHNYEFYKYYKRTVFNYCMAKHHIKDTEGLNFEIKEDIKTITADYLVENIDYAFKVWQMPWNKGLLFNEFCEYILPYRYGYEELQPWRKAYYESNKHLLDTFKNERDPVKVGMYLRALHDTTRSEITELKGMGDAIRPLDLVRINTTTSCKDESGVVLLRLRALGVPIARLTIPNWGNWGTGHDVNGVFTPDKKWFPFAGGIDSKAYIPPSQFTTTKLFAETYSDGNSGFIADIKTAYSYEVIPNYIDVTKCITNPVDLTIPFANVKNGTEICLCVFNNIRWLPVAHSTVYNGRAIFQQMGKRVIYMAGTITSGALKLIDSPFLLDSNGVVKQIQPSLKNKVITLFRKYPPNESLDNFMPTLNGCYFQGSNDSAFAKAVTLWKIDKLTGLHTLEKTLKNAKYQYIKLVFPGIERKNEELGGIQIYGDGKTLLTGEPISSVKAFKTFYTHVFDNDPLTFIRLLARKYADFDQFLDGESLVIPDKQPFWIGLKFKNKTNITSLGFSPRTDDNDVNAGEIYKLFYWNNGIWESAGMKRAVGNKIEFSVPENALYALKDLDKGKEQRIFLYQGNKQVWY